VKVSVKTEGFREMDAALGEYSKATARNVLIRAGLKALAPIAATAKAKAHRRTGDLQDSIDVATKLGKRQRRLNREPSTVEIYAGPTATDGENPPPQGIWEEFGTEDHPPHAFLRPAWDGGQNEVLDAVKEELAGEIDKATARAQRKALRAKR
jgi:HK97 gp10 family phage protein